MNARSSESSPNGDDAIEERLERVDWSRLCTDLNERGCASMQRLLSDGECNALARLYDDDNKFRSRVVMSRHGYGRGEYQYFSYPLPALVEELRGALYSKLVTLANEWHASMKLESTFPSEHARFIELCHTAGQTRPTPLILRYGAGDYNCLHQDLYGEHVFPLQVAVLLSQPGRDFDGGEFVLTEQRPRMQSRVDVVPLQQGDAVVFAVHQRPVRGTHGFYRVNMRHGVSRLHTGRRHTLGIIFHDAK